ncbi:MAG: sulfotransferase [uncultured bacterium]|nr:MAG: sulfotransferase [uncultured bacterium]
MLTTNVSFDGAEFLGIGVHKGGTSWIHACLYEHPQIFMPPDKELHFFSRNYEKGIEWYLNHFKLRGSNQICGEISPTYMHSIDAPDRIFNYNKKIKLIVSLRNPVDRALSAYKYAKQIGEIKPSTSFETALNQDPAYIEYGLYGKQLERYLNFFDKSQILIVLYDDIKKDPAAFMRKIYHFIGVEENFRSRFIEKKVNVSKGVPKIPFIDKLLKKTADTLRSIGLGHLVWSLGRSRLIELMLEFNTDDFNKHCEIDSAYKVKLIKIFKQDIMTLSKIMGTDMMKVWGLHS